MQAIDARDEAEEASDSHGKNASQASLASGTSGEHACAADGQVLFDHGSCTRLSSAPSTLDKTS